MNDYNKNPMTTGRLLEVIAWAQLAATGGVQLDQSTYTDRSSLNDCNGAGSIISNLTATRPVKVGSETVNSVGIGTKALTTDCLLTLISQHLTAEEQLHTMLKRIGRRFPQIATENISFNEYLQSQKAVSIHIFVIMKESGTERIEGQTGSSGAPTESVDPAVDRDIGREPEYQEPAGSFDSFKNKAIGMDWAAAMEFSAVLCPKEVSPSPDEHVSVEIYGYVLRLPRNPHHRIRIAMRGSKMTLIDTHSDKYLKQLQQVANMFPEHVEEKEELDEYLRASLQAVRRLDVAHESRGKRERDG
ncbi:hypothetical protein NMY22_g2451 [Coprinellus aureogranulatus]|nr:hypothetical protein NMY22_g2451 [Coprinellus aureogranulatus]